MKKIISMLLIYSLFAVLLVSCTSGGLSGTYTCDDRYPMIDGKVNEIIFDGNKCTICEGSLYYEDLDWKITDGKLTITGEAEFILGNIKFDYEYDFSQEGDSIFLDGFEFKKNS